MDNNQLDGIPQQEFFDEGIHVPKPRGLFGTWQRAAGEDDISPQNQRI
ncbi:hypothetical protein AB3Y40_18920 [Yoonia sp. R2331]